MAAFSAAALSSVRLKKVKKSKALEQREKTKFAKQLCEDEGDYYRLVKETFLEEYYEKIKGHTFPTEYIPLAKDDVRALCIEYNQLEGPFDTSNGPIEANILEFEEDGNGRKALDLVTEMAQKIDEIKERNGWKHAFVRMSIRSPKDAALSSQKFSDILEKEYVSLCEVYGPEAPEWVTFNGGMHSSDKRTSEHKKQIWKHNLRIIACYRAQTYALATTTGTEAMGLLTRSKRIQGDMYSLLDGTYNNCFQLCVREFRHFDVCFEFRSFVYESKLTGLTQYNDLCFFPDLLKHKAAIQSKIESFVKTAVEKLEMENMVLDLVLVDANSIEMLQQGWPALTEERLAAMEVIIIEVNPLAEFAGGGLFEWNADKDVLLGHKPFEFRVQSALTQHASADLMEEWKPFVYPPSETVSD
eukprot:m.348030 g.348030  ORF g.348030 m.348030 type:complete len:414 (-) comp35286_c0_seq1:40-1281(-)